MTSQIIGHTIISILNKQARLKATVKAQRSPRKQTPEENLWQPAWSVKRVWANTIENSRMASSGVNLFGDKLAPLSPFGSPCWSYFRGKYGKDKLHLYLYMQWNDYHDWVRNSEMEEELQKIYWNLVELAEVRRNGNKQIKLKSGRNFYYGSTETGIKSAALALW